jgi:hypothetical protein
MNKTEPQSTPEQGPGESSGRASWRVQLGFLIFIVSIGWPVLVPVLTLWGVSAASIATFSGVMLIASELLLLAGAAVAGKEGFDFIKQRVFGFLKSYGPPQKVSRTRYRIGLVLFLVPLLFGWAAPYFGHHVPGYESSPVTYAIGGDLMLLISLFLLGGDFWDKLHSLFLHDATANITKKDTAELQSAKVLPEL